MSKIMYKGISYANAGVSSDATSIPTADMTAAFDSTAHMNSEDMTSQEVEDFVDGLTPSALEVETASYNGITAYRYGKVVTLVIVAGTITASSAGWTTIDTIGERFRPPTGIFSVGYDNSDTSWDNSRPLMLAITTAGNVNAYLFSGKLSVIPRATITYIVNS